MAQQTLDTAAIQINRARLLNMRQPDPTYQHSSLARWEQHGIIAYAWLEEVEPGQWPWGIFVAGASTLGCTYDRVTHLGKLGARQEALGQEMADQLRAHIVDAMHANGWQVIYHTKAGRDIWHQEPDPRRTFPLETNQADQVALDMAAIQINQAQLQYTGYQTPGYQGLSFACWEQQDMRAYAWLEEVGQGQRPAGHFIDASARILTCSFDRVSQPGVMSSRQEAFGQAMIKHLRARLVDAMRANGWQIIYQSPDGQDIWYPERFLQRHPELVALDDTDRATDSAVNERDLPESILAGAGAEVPGDTQVREVELASQDERLEPRQSHIIEVIGSEEAKGRGQQPAYRREVFTREVTFTCIVCHTTVTQQRFPGNTPLYCGDGCKGERQREKTKERVAKHREEKKKAAGSELSQGETTKA